MCTAQDSQDEENCSANPVGNTQSNDCTSSTPEHVEYFTRLKLSKEREAAPGPGCYYIRYYSDAALDHVAYYEGTLRISPHTLPTAPYVDYSLKHWEITDIPAFSDRIKELDRQLGIHPNQKPLVLRLRSKVEELKTKEEEKEKEAKKLFGIPEYSGDPPAQTHCKIQKITDEICSIHKELAILNKEVVELIQRFLDSEIYGLKTFDPTKPFPLEEKISPIVADLRSRIKNPLNPLSLERFRRLVAESAFAGILTPHPTHKLRISGDLYVCEHQFRDVAEPLRKDPSLLSSTSGLSSSLIEKLTNLDDIPIFPRDRYRFYLRPTFVQPGHPTPEKFSCDFQVNHFDPEKHEFTGQGLRTFQFFETTEEESDNIKNVLFENASTGQAPSSTILDSPMIASVMDNQKRIVGKAVICRVQPRFLRRAELEIRYTADQVDPTRIPGAIASDHTRNWIDVFKTVDWNLKVDAQNATIETINKLIPEPTTDTPSNIGGLRTDKCVALTSSLHPIPPEAFHLKNDEDLKKRAFTPEELHTGMEADKSPLQGSLRLPKQIPPASSSTPVSKTQDRELDLQWKYHLLCVSKIKGYGRGVMYDVGVYDRNRFPREGAAVAWNYQFPDAATLLMFHDKTGQKPHPDLPWQSSLMDFPALTIILISEISNSTVPPVFELEIGKLDRTKNYTPLPQQDQQTFRRIFNEALPLLSHVIEEARTEALSKQNTGVAETPLATALVNLILRLCGIPETYLTTYERHVFAPIQVLVNKSLNDPSIKFDPNSNVPRNLKVVAPLYFRTAVHEVGHLMGLGHNFRSNGFMNTTDIIAANWPLQRAQREYAELQQLERLYQTKAMFLDQKDQTHWNPRKTAGDSVRNIESSMIRSHEEVSEASLKALKPKIAKARLKYQEMIKDVREFPDNVILEFDPYDADYLRHGPDICVRPGAKVANPISNETLKKSLIAQGLQFSIRPIQSEFPFGAPVRLELLLKNVTDQSDQPRDLFVPDSLNFEHGGLRGWSVSPSGQISYLDPIATRDDEIVSIQPLSPGEFLRKSVTLLPGTSQAIYSTPGVFKLNLTFSWELVSDKLLDSKTIHEFKVAALAEIEITSPETEYQNEVAERILFSPKLTRFLVSDVAPPGNTEILQTLQGVPQLARHYDLSAIKWYYEMFKAPPTETLRAPAARAASLETAARAYRPDTVATEAELSLVRKAVADFHLIDPERAPEATFPPLQAHLKNGKATPEDLLATKVLLRASAKLPTTGVIFDPVL
jgi:hypothetical protein